MAVPCAVSTEERKKKISVNPCKQKTLKKSVSISGVGLFTGEKTTLTIRPAAPDTGIVFQRMDLPKKPFLFAILQNVVSTLRCTILGNKNFTIHTVEHVLAALKAMGIDNACLQLSGPEVPIMDGSAQCFIEALEEGESTLQSSEKLIYTLTSPFSFSKGDVHLVALPSKEYRVSYTLHFPKSELFRSQYYSTLITPEIFMRDLAPSRTFCFYEEIAPFIESGLIKGGSLENAIIIKEDKVVNPEGVRFQDEPVRHKILDFIGDLSLIPYHINAHFVAIRSGHQSNIAFAQELFNHIKMENS